LNKEKLFGDLLSQTIWELQTSYSPEKSRHVGRMAGGKDEKKRYRIPVPGLGQKQGYGWGCPSQQAKNDCALAVGDKIFVVKRIVNNPANTPSLRSRRAVLFINIVPFCLVERTRQETQVISVSATVRPRKF
jgi:hypothetical protein